MALEIRLATAPKALEDPDPVEAAGPAHESRAARRTMTMSETTSNPAQDEDSTRETPSEHRGFSFADMQLAVGDRLQIECPSGTGAGRAFSRVVGYLENRSLLITAPVASRQRIDLVDNDMVVVRVFSRQNAFAFRASVLRASKLPFHYVHLSFPQTIQGSVIRKATRVRTELAATATVVGDDGRSAPGTLLNISATGVLLRTRAALGERGGQLRLRFELPLHEVDTPLDVEADIRNVREDVDDEGTEYHNGLDFRDLAANDRMLVKSFVYQTIIEQPRQVL